MVDFSLILSFSAKMLLKRTLLSVQARKVYLENRNTYSTVSCKILSNDQSFGSKSKFKTSDDEVRKVSFERCCKGRCCQTFSWESMKNHRRKFYACSFEVRREIAYAVQKQFDVRTLGNKIFITLEWVAVCENAYYIIHGVSRSAYYVYKAVAIGRSVSGCHSNASSLRPRSLTIQARATLKKIMDKNADQMLFEFRLGGNKRVNNFKVVPSTMSGDHMREHVNDVSSHPLIYLLLVYVFISLISTTSRHTHSSPSSFLRFLDTYLCMLVFDVSAASRLTQHLEIDALRQLSSFVPIGCQPIDYPSPSSYTFIS